MATRQQNRTSGFTFKPFSLKQTQVMTWWTDGSAVHDADGIIADGAIRSGKTLSMSLSFVLWAMNAYNDGLFIMCGKTIASFRRNVLYWLVQMLVTCGYNVHERRGDNLFTVSKGDKMNTFHIFGGQDEGSQDLVQGLTAAGAFFDEVALMPESFVNQATGRCSVEGSKLWFNCNPQMPTHWFKEQWIDRGEEQRIPTAAFWLLSQLHRSRFHVIHRGDQGHRAQCGEDSDGIVAAESAAQ